MGKKIYTNLFVVLLALGISFKVSMLVIYSGFNIILMVHYSHYLGGAAQRN